MKLQHRARLDVPADRVWAFLMDVPRAARCVPGVETVTALDGERYRGRLHVQMGPIRLALDGDITIVGRDDAAHRATMRAEASDKRAGGGIRALADLALEGDTELHVDTDLQILGRIGELGQPLIKRKADQLLAEFVANVGRALTEPVP